MKHLKRFFAELLMVRMIRTAVGKLRFLYYARILRHVRTRESKDAIEHTVEHNLKAIAAFGLTRMDRLIKPVSVIESIGKDSKILVIGPRNEDDILNLIGNGFNSRNITGLDLISYSPFIEVGDMHETRFPDAYFDVIICGWTLSYSNQPAKWAQEMIRITKDHGVVAIAVEYSTLTNEQATKLHHGGYHLNPVNCERINSTGQILELFGEHVGAVFFNHDAPNKISHGDQLNNDVSSVVAIFSLKKAKA